MTHVVTTARAAVRTAVATALPGVTMTKSWWRVRDAASLPIFTVMTPRAQVSRFDDDTVDRLTEFHVVLKSTGDEDLEDDLYALASAIEQAVMPVLAGLSHDYDLDEIAIGPDGAGAKDVGELRLLFSARLLTAEAQPETLQAPD